MDLDNAIQSIQNIIEWDGWTLVWYLVWFSVVVLWLALVFWTLKDARKRIEDVLIIAVAVATSLVFPFIGTLVYTILRPAEYLADVRERDLEMRAMEQELRVSRVCPNCREPVRDDYVICPKCRKGLRTPCDTCSRPLEYSWKVCPYCGAEPHPRRSVSPLEEPTEVLGGGAV
ncbi:MAG: zinc ribbon domain-containing protein [Thermoleophilia bacterium]|nr:zinc ribbon domain-containing protein [Thermoleophilia bacterium]